MEIIGALRAFIRLADVGSFSAVARDLGVTQPAVSRQIAALEEHLGARLVHRTTRKLVLTEDGRDFVPAARAVLEALDRAEITVGRRHGGIDGVVRVGAPNVFSRVQIMPRLHLLLERHPGLSIDLVRDDGASNLVEDGVDVAVRVGDLPNDSAYVARRIGAFQRLIVGSAAYLDRVPAPLKPRDLADHSCILDGRSVGHDYWTLNGSDGPVTVPVSGRFRTDSAEAGREAVVTGLGLAAVATWLIGKELEDGSIRAVLQDWQMPPVLAHVIYPSRRHLAARTRAVIDFLVHEIKEDMRHSE